ncbi:uncharacterized protein METZ01_LOCUS286045, partial [marine metagenome]
RTSASHAENAGSIPAGDTSFSSTTHYFFYME